MQRFAYILLVVLGLSAGCAREQEAKYTFPTTPLPDANTLKLTSAGSGPSKTNNAEKPKDKDAKNKASENGSGTDKPKEDK